MSEVKLVRIWNDTESKRLPAGKRIVRAEVGPKWVRVWEHGAENAARLRRKTFDAIYLEDVTTS